MAPTTLGVVISIIFFLGFIIAFVFLHKVPKTDENNPKTITLSVIAFTCFGGLVAALFLTRILKNEWKEMHFLANYQEVDWLLDSKKFTMYSDPEAYKRLLIPLNWKLLTGPYGEQLWENKWTGNQIIVNV